jgi:transcriptional regulator with XRE-family HTH domain
MKKKGLSPIADRIRLLIEELCHGSQRSLASLAGCSQAALSKILLGKQEPGKRVLEMIAGIPRVNPAWLFDGVGSPLVDPPPVVPRFEASVPIVTGLVPGPLRDFKSYRSSRAIYVSETVASESVYGVLASECVPAVRCPAEAMLDGDFLIIDSDKSRWQSNLGILDDRLVAIKTCVEGSETVELHRIRCTPCSDENIKWLHLQSTMELLICIHVESVAQPYAGRALDIRGKGREFFETDIVGVVEQLVRLFDGLRYRIPENAPASV